MILKSVELIKSQNLQISNEFFKDLIFLNEIKDPSRGSNDHMWNLLNDFRLAYKVLSSGQNSHSDIDVASKEQKKVSKPISQFPWWNNYQRMHSERVSGKLVQNGQNENQTFSLSCEGVCLLFYQLRFSLIKWRVVLLFALVSNSLYLQVKASVWENQQFISPLLPFIDL